MPDKSSSTALTSLLNWLRQRHTEIKKCEDKALAALYDAKDEPAYRDLMWERSGMIESLGRNAAKYITALPLPLREEVREQLDGFAQGARNALKLNSVFYMSALLYPDEHQEGEPDNLEILINELAEV